MAMLGATTRSVAASLVLHSALFAFAAHHPAPRPILSAGRAAEAADVLVEIGAAGEPQPASASEGPSAGERPEASVPIEPVPRPLRSIERAVAKPKAPAPATPAPEPPAPVPAASPAPAAATAAGSAEAPPVAPSGSASGSSGVPGSGAINVPGIGGNSRAGGAGSSGAEGGMSSGARAALLARYLKAARQRVADQREY